MKRMMEQIKAFPMGKAAEGRMRGGLAMIAR